VVSRRRCGVVVGVALPYNSFEGGDDWLVIIAMCNGFTFLFILLVGELEVDFGAVVEFSSRNSSGIEGTMWGLKGHVHQMERMIVFLAVDMFTWS